MASFTPGMVRTLYCVPAPYGKRPAHEMRSFHRGSILGSILGIVFCGGVGGVVAWAVVALIGWDGTLGAIVAAIIGMVVATAVWIAWTSLLRSVSRPR